MAIFLCYRAEERPPESGKSHVLNARIRAFSMGFPLHTEAGNPGFLVLRNPGFLGFPLRFF